jgi:rod shape-determining protein MreD
MARLLFGLLLAFAALLQATIVPRVNPLSVSPDLALVLLFTWSISRGTREALFWAFFGGIMVDVFANDPFGTNALALLAVVLLASLARQRMFQANVLIPMVLVVFATIVHGIVLLALRGTLPSGWNILLQAGMHALIVPVVLLVARIIRR